MFEGLQIATVVPARNEASSIAAVVRDLAGLECAPGKPLLDRIIVCDNGSIDKTAVFAKRAGAEVVEEPIAGYGAACMRALKHIQDADIVVFVDADQSVVVSELPLLIKKLLSDLDMVIGVRVQSLREPGSMTIPQRCGNALASFLIKAIWREKIRNLGPFRALRANSLEKLNMQNQRFGWTVEMQIKAIQHGLRVGEVDVSCRCRVGRSKISGTITGVLIAGFDILATIASLARAPGR